MSPDAPLTLTQAQLLKVLRGMHGIAEGQNEALLARLKHMQRLNFPKAKGVGRGQREQYDLDQIAKLATAFQLLALGLSSALAAEVVSGGWPLFAEAFRLSSRKRGSRLVAIRPDDPIITAKSRARHATPLARTVLIDRERPLPQPAEEDGAALVVLDAWSLAGRLSRELGLAAGIPRKAIASELARLGESAGEAD